MAGTKAAMENQAYSKRLTENGKSVSNTTGAMTIEAALVLPVILCAFLSVVFIIKAVYTYEIIQHALDETASEIAASGYIYHVSGIRDIHDSVRDGIGDKSNIFKSQLGSVFDAYNSLSNIRKGITNDLPQIEESSDLLSNAGQSFLNVFDNAGYIASNPLDELKLIACYIASGSFENAKTELFTPLVRFYMKKHLVTEGTTDVNERLKALNIKGGLDGLDFSGSSFLSDSNEDIDIVVRYCVKLPIPIQFGSGLDIAQRVRIKAWMGGDEAKGVLDKASSIEDIWSLSNFQRGRKIQRLFGANLPFNFPVIAKFENGKAVMIKSMDLTAASYQNSINVQKTIKGYIKELAAFVGQNKPWGSSGIAIPKEHIENKELLLVIPENKLTDSCERVLTEMAVFAQARDITLIVNRFGTKVLDNEDKETEG